MKRIAHIIDIHLNEDYPVSIGVNCAENWQTILNDLKSRKINELVFGGDIGNSSSHKWFFESLKDYSGILHVTPGNHDKFEELAKSFSRISAAKHELYYSDDSNNTYKYIYLDTSTSVFSYPQFQWLKKQLITEKDIIIFIHHPVLEADTIVDRLYLLTGRKELHALLGSIPNKITIFCGHLHCEDSKTEGNITQHVTPASSYQVLKHTEKDIPDASLFGYRLIEAGKEITTSLVLFKNE